MILNTYSRELISGYDIENYKTVFRGLADIEVNFSLNAMALKDTQGTIVGFILPFEVLKRSKY